MSVASPIRRARADALAQLLGGAYYRGQIRLTGEAYSYLAALGLNRASVAAAVDELVQEGRARVTVQRGVVVVRAER